MGFTSSSDAPHQTNNERTNTGRITTATATTTGVREPFQILTTALLSLLLPLSFLLLARLSTAQYLISVADAYPTPITSLCSLFLYTKTPIVLQLLISIISVSTLTHALTGKTPFITTQSPDPPIRHRLYAAWIFLCLLQTTVGLGIEGSIAAGIEGSAFGQDLGFVCRTVFFFGLHETMAFWGRTVVKPVVDDTIFGGWRKEGWAEKAAVGAGYGGLWWWRLREEVEALVVVPEVKRELMMGIGAADFVGWWLYYLTVTIGMVRLVKGMIFAVAVLTRRRHGGDDDDHNNGRCNDEKV